MNERVAVAKEIPRRFVDPSDQFLCCPSLKDSTVRAPLAPHRRQERQKCDVSSVIPDSLDGLAA